MLTGNLGDKLIPQNEILRDVSDLKALANLQESMEWLAGRLKGFFSSLPPASSEYLEKHLFVFVCMCVCLCLCDGVSVFVSLSA